MGDSMNHGWNTETDATYIDYKQFYKDMCAKHFLEIKRLEKELRGRLTLEAEVERLVALYKELACSIWQMPLEEYEEGKHKQTCREADQQAMAVVVLQSEVEQLKKDISLWKEVAENLQGENELWRNLKDAASPPEIYSEEAFLRKRADR